MKTNAVIVDATVHETAEIDEEKLILNEIVRETFSP